jgi:hypothetical protein
MPPQLCSLGVFGFPTTSPNAVNPIDQSRAVRGVPIRWCDRPPQEPGWRQIEPLKFESDSKFCRRAPANDGPHPSVLFGG